MLKAERTKDVQCRKEWSRKHGHDTVTMKIVTQQSSSPRKTRKQQRAKKWLKGNVNVGLKLIYGPSMMSALTVKRN